MIQDVKIRKKNKKRLEVIFNPTFSQMVEQTSNKGIGENTIQIMMDVIMIGLTESCSERVKVSIRRETTSPSRIVVESYL